MLTPQMKEIEKMGSKSLNAYLLGEVLPGVLYNFTVSLIIQH